MDHVDEFIASVQAEYQALVRSGRMGSILFSDAEYAKLIEAYIEQAYIDGQDCQATGFSDEVLVFVRTCEGIRVREMMVGTVLRGEARPRMHAHGENLVLFPFNLEFV